MGYPSGARLSGLGLLGFLILAWALPQPAWAAPGGGGQTPAAAELPATPVGRLARLFLDALNSGDEQRLRGFVSASYSVLSRQ